MSKADEIIAQEIERAAKAADDHNRRYIHKHGQTSSQDVLEALEYALAEVYILTATVDILFERLKNVENRQDHHSGSISRLIEIVEPEAFAEINRALDEADGDVETAIEIIQFSKNTDVGEA